MTNEEFYKRQLSPVVSLTDLALARALRLSVIVPNSSIFGIKPKPAAFMMNLSGDILRRLFEDGMYIYRPMLRKS